MLGFDMVRYRRNFIAGGTFFFTVTLRNRRSRVLTDHIGLLRAAFRKTRAELPFVAEAIVVLPDHLHAIWTLPDGDAAFSLRWQRIKGAFTRSVIRAGVPLHKDRRGEYDLWQRRFWEHTIRDDADLQRCVDYIHFNPVKHGLVTTVSKWKYSSFHRYVRTGMLTLDWGGDVRSVSGDFGEPL